jgi:hypothetical protein
MIIVNRHGDMVLFNGAFVLSSEKRATVVTIGNNQLVTGARAIVLVFNMFTGRFCLVLKRWEWGFTPHFKRWG